MRGITKSFITLLSLYCCFASATRCLYLPSGQYCCGLAIGAFGTGITEAFAQSLGYFAEEGIPSICNYKVPSSVFMYDTLLANGTLDFVMSNMDNAVWRLLNFGTPLTVLAGTDGARGYYLIGNSKILNGWNSVAALNNQNIAVDSVDSGFVVGLRKILKDYGVTNFTFIPVGGNRLPYVQNGYNVINGVNISIAGAVLDNTAPYLPTFTYPIVNLAQQAEHFCPSQGTGYVAPTSWLQDPQNFNNVTSYFRALVRSYKYISDPANVVAVKAWIATNIGLNNYGIVELVYDDYFNNPATGLCPYNTPRKNGMRNIIDARISFGLSPPPAQGVDALLADTPLGFVDLRPLKQAQAAFGVVDDYDTNPHYIGCPVYNTGTIVPGPPAFTCSVSYTISNQPPCVPYQSIMEYRRCFFFHSWHSNQLHSDISQLQHRVSLIWLQCLYYAFSSW